MIFNLSCFENNVLFSVGVRVIIENNVLFSVGVRVIRKLTIDTKTNHQNTASDKLNMALLIGFTGEAII